MRTFDQPITATLTDGDWLDIRCALLALATLPDYYSEANRLYDLLAEQTQQPIAKVWTGQA